MGRGGHGAHAPPAHANGMQRLPSSCNPYHRDTESLRQPRLYMDLRPYIDCGPITVRWPRMHSQLALLRSLSSHLGRLHGAMPSEAACQRECGAAAHQAGGALSCLLGAESSSQVMAPPAGGARSETPAERAHMAFVSLGLRHLVVTDEGSCVRGIITRRNLDQAAGHGAWRRNRMAPARAQPRPPAAGGGPAAAR